MFGGVGEVGGGEGGGGREVDAWGDDVGAGREGEGAGAIRGGRRVVDLEAGSERRRHGRRVAVEDARTKGSVRVWCGCVRGRGAYESSRRAGASE